MARLSFSKSAKHLQIDKANARLMLTVAIASFVTVFSLVAAKALLSQKAYQARVISGKEKAKKQLVTNVAAANSLVSSYQVFVSAKQNLLGGANAGKGDKDGDNAKIILDALPSKYDFPALATSLEKLLNDTNFKINGITGTDDEIAQSKSEQSGKPQPVEIPFQLAIGSNYDSVKNLVSILERSIRPINIQQISLSGQENSMQISISAKTYYQPEKTLTITKQAIK